MDEEGGICEGDGADGSREEMKRDGSEGSEEREGPEELAGKGDAMR